MRYGIPDFKMEKQVVQRRADQMIAEGATEIVVLPYFLSAGRHVYEDIPAIIDSKRSQYKNLKLQVAPYLGEAGDLIEVLANLTQQVDGQQ